METTRTIHELLIILRDNVKPNVKRSLFGLKQRISFGLCFETSGLWISNIFSIQEENLLRGYIMKNKPEYRGTPYGWKISLWRPRLRWLNKHIKLTADGKRNNNKG